MVFKFLFALAVISGAVWELEAASSCAPDCRSSAAGDVVAVPWDCRLYSTCGDILGDGLLYPSEPESCAEGFYFNPNNPLGAGCSAIALADDGYCTPSCDPCERLWSFLGDTTPYPDDCSQYQVCLDNGVFFAATCTEADGGLYYDYFEGGCQDDQNRCFTSCDRCTPYCIEDYRGGNIIDPSDCTAYYSCDPPDTTHYLCPSTEIFDSVTGVCSASATCVEECVTR